MFSGKQTRKKDEGISIKNKYPARYFKRQICVESINIIDMSYFGSVLMYCIWLLTIAVGYFASEYAIKQFDKRWKEATESEEQSSNIHREVQ